MIKRQSVLKEIAERTGVDQRVAGQVVDTFFEALAEHLVQGDAYNVARFATFKPVDRAARVGRNPTTLEVITIDPQKSVKLVLSDHLKQRLNSN